MARFRLNTTGVLPTGKTYGTLISESWLLASTTGWLDLIRQGPAGPPSDDGAGPREQLVISADGARPCIHGVPVAHRGSPFANELAEAADDRQLTKTIARYGRADLLCIGELGYMELDRRGAELLFQVLTEREETASVAIASNESFSGWTKTFTDPASAPRSPAASPSTPPSSRPPPSPAASPAPRPAPPSQPPEGLPMSIGGDGAFQFLICVGTTGQAPALTT